VAKFGKSNQVRTISLKAAVRSCINKQTTMPVKEEEEDTILTIQVLNLIELVCCNQDTIQIQVLINP